MEVARELARHEGDLSLDGLSTITPEVAHELANYDGEWLSLDGLTSISVEVARELAKHDGEWLSLDGLTSITEEVARELAMNEEIDFELPIEEEIEKSK